MKKRYSFRFDETDVMTWKGMSDEAGFTLSEWIRRRCNGDAREILRPGSIVDTENPKNFEEAVTKRVKKVQEERCSHGFMAGKCYNSFCRNYGRGK